MQITISLDGNESQETVKRLQTSISALYGIFSLYGDAKALLFGVDLSSESKSTGVLKPSEIAEDDALSFRGVKIVENPALAPGTIAAFGQQPLPAGATPPLAPSADTPAAVETSASAPAEPPVSSVPPVPPSPAAASTPAAPAASPAPANVARDTAGLPWDERIHSGTRAKNKDGTWRLKRGVDSTLVAQVEAQLRGEAHTVPTPPADSPLAPPAAAPAPPPPPTAGAASPVPTFGELVQRVQAAMQSNKLSGTVLSVKLSELGLLGIHEVNNRPDLIAKVIEALGV